MIKYLVILLVFIVGCDRIKPLTTTVKEDQPDYQTPSNFTVTVRKVKDANDVCGHDIGEPNIYGCLIGTETGGYKIYFTEKSVLDHEFNHIVFGPLHNG